MIIQITEVTITIEITKKSEHLTVTPSTMEYFKTQPRNVSGSNEKHMKQN